MCQTLKVRLSFFVNGSEGCPTKNCYGLAMLRSRCAVLKARLKFTQCNSAKLGQNGSADTHGSRVDGMPSAYDILRKVPGGRETCAATVSRFSHAWSESR
jgi:hypothetical protein